MVGKADDTTSPLLAPPSIYDAYPLTQRSLAPPPALERALSQQRLPMATDDDMGARRMQELFGHTRADDEDDDEARSSSTASSPMHQRQRGERRSATMFSRFGKFTGEVYETKERSRMINVLKRRSRTPAAGGANGGAAIGGGGASAANASSKFTADDVLRAGMLTKQGSWRRNWKTRFFILRSDYPSLSYYKSEEKLELLGSVPITGDTLVLDKSASGGHAPFRFQLRTDAMGAALLLETETRDNQQRWMDACQELVDALRAEKFRQSTMTVDRDPTTAVRPTKPSVSERTRPSMGVANPTGQRPTITRAGSSSAIMSTSAPSGSLQHMLNGPSSRIRQTNHQAANHGSGLTALDASSDEEDNQKDDDNDDDDDDELWSTGKTHNFLVVLDESTRQQNLQQIHQTQLVRRASLEAAHQKSRVPDLRLRTNPAPAFELVLELALGRQSKLLSRSDDKLRCCVRVVGYVAAAKRCVELGTTDAVAVATQTQNQNPDTNAAPVRVAFSAVLQADLDKFDQLRFTVYRTTSKSNASRSSVGIGRCFVDDAFKTLGAPRLVALAEKSSSFPDILGASMNRSNDPPSTTTTNTTARGGSSSSLLTVNSNAIHLVVQAFPSLAPQHVLPTSGVDMASAKYLLPTTLSNEPLSSSGSLSSTSPSPSQRVIDNGSFLTTSSESPPPHARLIVVDEILRAPQATFALPLAFLDFLDETALERTRVLQKQVDADGRDDKESTAMLAFELDFYRRKLEEYLRQRQFLMKQEKKLLDEAREPTIYQYAVEQMSLRAAKQNGGAETVEDLSSSRIEMTAPFKRSTFKSLDLWQFVATNMQDQFLCAHQPSHLDTAGSAIQPFVWHTMTMGCPAAHTKGFASGGFPLTASVLEASRVSASATASTPYSTSCFSDDDMENELFATGGGNTSSRPSLPMDMLRRRSRASLSATNRTSQSSANNNNPAQDVATDSVAALKQRLELKDRLDIVASQALSATVACLTASLDLAVAGSESHRLQLVNAAKCGFLVHFESLLSTQGKEVGMLEDFAAAAKWLRNVFIQFRRHNNSTGASGGQYFSIKNYAPPERARGVAGGTGLDRAYNPAPSLRVADQAATSSPPPPPGYVLVTMGVTDAQLAVLPASLASGSKPLRVRCVLFTQGVNEKQSLAHALKSQTVKVQDRINRENVEELKEIYGVFRRVHGGDSSVLAKTQSPGTSKYSLEALDDLLTRIEQHVYESSSQYKKNVGVLTDTSDFCRELGGARVTCCKSGKDRTAMSVTLEQTRLCVSRLKVASTQAKALCATMRQVGVRRKNVFLNTKSTKFAFNEMQRKMLPDCYKPPAGTYKSGTT